MKALGVLLLVIGVGLTGAGLFGQLVLTDNEGHHDGRVPTFALEAVSGADELVVEPVVPGEVDVRIERAGQPLVDYEQLHGARFHTFVAAEDLSSYAHAATDDVGNDGIVPLVGIGAGALRVLAQAAPSGGPDLLELGADVLADGAPLDAQNIATNDEWTENGLTVTRQGLDFVLSRDWNGDDHMGAPAFLAMFRADDLAFVHDHAELIGNDRFTFSTDLPGLGEYLAAVEFVQDGELVTALFRFEL